LRFSLKQKIQIGWSLREELIGDCGEVRLIENRVCLFALLEKMCYQWKRKKVKRRNAPRGVCLLVFVRRIHLL
jgi:hypothetical protein